MQPLIGLTCFRQLNSSGHPVLSVNEAYCRAVRRAGGVPVLIPLGLDQAEIDTLAARLDGIVFTGGGDIRPETYGATPHPLVDEVDADRDRVEIDLVHRAVKQHKPLLGICRGLQVINVAQGGTLYEDILDQRENALRHAYYPDWPRDHPAHTVRLEPGSRLARLTGMDEVDVNSLHHQGIRRLGDRLRATAYAPDGLIEAVEYQDYSFGLAVQWHPEWLPDSAPMQAIFSALVRAAQGEPAPDAPR